MRFGIVLLLLCFSFHVSGLAAAKPSIQAAMVSGSFYISDPVQLRQMVTSYLDQAPTPDVASQNILGGIVPHAGHVFSGMVAAHTFRAIQQLKPKTIIILGTSHYKLLDGAAVLTANFCETPLGLVTVDVALAQKIVASSPLFQKSAADLTHEHSIEVELPFLQVALKDQAFNIVPIYVAVGQVQQAEDMVAALLPLLASQNVFVLASTDWSHYHNDADDQKLDKTGLFHLRSMLVSKFVAAYGGDEFEMCNFGGVYMLMKLAEQLGYWNVSLLDYRNSFATTGLHPERVVGYASVLFKEGKKMNSDQQKALLSLARETIVNKIRYGSYTLKNEPPDPAFARPLGAFVTLKLNGELHGCIGYIQSDNTLYQNIQDCAIKAALQDPRFPPLQEEELDEMQLEISVLSSLQPLRDVKDIRIGDMGLVMQKGAQRGLLLPQVAVEQKWTVQQFLLGMCQKAGLPMGSWKDPAVQMFYFTAEVFAEY